MNKNNLIQQIYIERIAEEGHVWSRANCPICENNEECMVHYGEEEKTKESTLFKMLSHIRREHNEPSEE